MPLPIHVCGWVSAMSFAQSLKNPSLIIGAAIVTVIILLAIFAPLVSFYDVGAMDISNRFSLPSSVHWLGTDNLGRDLWARMVWGARISLTIAVITVSTAALIGTVVGIVAGYFGGWIDLLLMRVTDIFLGFPAIILALAIVAVMGPGVLNIAIALIAVTWTEYARVVRSSALLLREQNYILAAKALSASHVRIIFQEMLPNALGPIIVLSSLGLGTVIIAESALSFLGFGLPPPTPTWGWTLAFGTRFIRDDPWMSIISGGTIMITVLGFNLLGDGLRDILDPHNISRKSSN
jgi:peptide/nickel transport system permease protein